MFSFRFQAFFLLFATGVLTAGPRPQVDKLYAQVPLRFEPNVGQADPAAPYVARGGGFRMLLTGSQAVLAPDKGSPLRMSLAGAREHLAAKAEDRLGSVTNYYFGSDPKNWRANVPNYGRVKFEQVYPGIDVVYYGNGQGLEYDLIVGPGADPTPIRWAYSGADSIRLDAAGHLVVALHGHEIQQGKPTIYQQVAGQRRAVQGEYQLAAGEVRLVLGEYDRTETLVIDPPVVVYSTFLGGSGDEDANGGGIAVDNLGATYITGNTTGGFPTLNAYQSAAGNTTNNAFVAKFNSNGGLVYSTYLSGSGGPPLFLDTESDGDAIAVDSGGLAYITGRTAGNFPLLLPEQGTYGGGAFDAFVAILTPTGNLQYSTYLGGSTDDEGSGIAVDSAGNIYAVGFTSGSFPTLNAAQATYGGGIDGFAVKLSSSGALSYSTYLGGSAEDEAYTVAVDGNGAAYIVGFTVSSDFPTLNPLQIAYGGGGDAFVVKLNTNGVRQYATYLGGPNYDIGFGIAVDSFGAAYVAGATAGGFPTVNASQGTFGGGSYDAVVAKLSPSGSSLLYSTYLGGAGSDFGYAVALDSTGAAYVAGYTTGSFPVVNAPQSEYGGSTDAFVAELSPSGGVVYATYWGGTGLDVAYGVAVDSTGAAYMTGLASAGFPTTGGSYQQGFGGGNLDAFVTKIGPAATISTATITGIGPDTAVAGGAGFTLMLNGSGFGTGTVYWNGTALPTTLGGSNSVTATVSASLIASSGIALVTFTNSGQSSSNAATFHIVTSPAVPTLTSAVPTVTQTCIGGATSEILDVRGAGIQPGVTFYWNGTSLGGYSAYPLINVPANLALLAGPVTITASNGGAISNGLSFTVPPPVNLTNLNPSSVPAGSGSVPLTATATNLATGYQLITGCFYGPINFQSLTQQVIGNQIQLTIPSASLTTAGTYYAFVLNFGGGGTWGSNTLPFTVTSGSSPSIVPPSLTFNYTIGGSQPSSQTASINGSSSGLTVSASAGTSSGGNWLSAQPASGLTPETLTVSVNTLGLPAGTYNGTVSLTVGAQLGTLPVALIISPSSQVTFALTPLVPSPASYTSAASGGTASLALVPNGSTAWTISSTDTWLHITSPAAGSGVGAATISYSVDANTGAARSASLNVLSGGDVVATMTVNQAAVSCTGLSVSPTSFTFGSTGGSGTLNFSTGGCAWLASSSNTSIVTVPASGSAATLNFTVAAGSTTQTVFITVNTTPPTTITVTRSAPACTYTISTPGAIAVTTSFSSSGGGGSVNVTTQPGCPWTATAPGGSFAGVTSGASGSGSGSMGYSVASNPAPTGNPARTTTLTIAGIAYTISEDPQGPQNYGCTVIAGVPTTMRLEGIAELAGDLVVNCSGFSLGNVRGDVLVTLNTSLTNHTLNSDPSGQTTDALLLVGEPSSGHLALTGSGQNAYRGTISGPLAVRFKNVSLAPVSGTFSQVFRITNVRVDANHLNGGSVTAKVSILSTAPFNLNNATQTVGFVNSGSGFALGSSSPAPAGKTQGIVFSENFATAYRVKLAAGQDPSAVGTVYNSESGYVNTAVLGADTGFSTNATRLVARFANIPAGTSIFAPVTQSSGSASAQLMSADSNGMGGLPMQGSAQVPGYQPVALVNGAGTATWEITGSNSASIDTLTFTLLSTNASLVLVNSCSAGSAPSVCGGLGPQVAVSIPNNTAPVPRFLNPIVSAPPQVTKLNIYPNQAIVGSGGVTAERASEYRPMDVVVHRGSTAVPLTSGGSSPPLSVGGSVTIGESLQSDINSPPAAGACVGNTLPPSFTITSCAADNGGTCTPTGGNSISTCFPTFDPGQSANITLIADSSTATPAELDANATSDLGNFGAGAFTQTVTPTPGPAIALTVGVPPSIPAGQPITYNITLNNSGSGAKLAGDPMTVVLRLNPDLTGISNNADPATWTCSGTTFIVCNSSSALPIQGSLGFSVTGTIPVTEGIGTVLPFSASLTFGGQMTAPLPVNTTVNPPLPAAFTLLTPANGATSVTSPVTLTWSQSTGATTYAVKFGTANPPPQVLSSTILLSFTPPALTAGATYFWQIVATNGSGSTPSAIGSFTAGTPPAAPALLSPPNGATGVSTSSALIWSAAAGATSYSVFLGTSNPPPQVVPSTTALTYSPPALTSSTTYFWKIVATNTGGSTASSVASFITGVQGPAAPTLLSPTNGATGISTSPSLTWSAAAGATSYSVAFGTSNPPPQVVPSTTALTYSPPALTSGTTYFWQVVATNSGGSAASGISSFITAVQVPAAPTLLSPTNGATGVSTSPSLTWSAAAGAASYSVLLGTSNPPQQVVPSTTSLTYSPPALTSGTTYFWQIVATNTAGSTASLIASFTTTVQVPAAPTLLSPANGATGVSTSPTLTWTAAAGATSYSVYLSTSNPPQQVVPSTTSLTYSSPALTPAVTYFWQIVATNTAGSTASLISSFTPNGPPSAPTLLSPASGATSVSTSPSLSWSAAAGATSYSVFLGTSNPPPQLVPSTTSLTYSPPVLTSGTTYYWQVIATNTAGSTASLISSFTTATSVQPPAAPTLLTPANGATNVSSSPSLTWTAPVGATGYSIFLGTSNPPPFVQTTVSLSYNPPALASGTTYFWQIVATNTAGSTASLISSFTIATVPQPPAAPTLLAPANGSTGVSTSPSLTWTAAAGATGYSIFFGTSNPPPFSQSTAALSYSPPALASNTTYFWQIIATNNAGSTASSIASFTTTFPGACQFSLAAGSVSLASAGTATTAGSSGGVLPEIPLTVAIIPGAVCSITYTAVSSATWLTATVSGNSFTYTALTNAHPKSQSATLTIANTAGGSQTFTVTEAGDAETLQNRQVRALYQSMLGRDPDPAGFSFWTGGGSAGLGQMGDSFLTSPEAFNSDFAVMAAYQAATGAVPTFAQFTAAVGSVRGGTQTISQLFTSLIAGNNSYSAATLYKNLLNRATSQGDSGCIATGLPACFQTLIAFPSSTTPVGTANNEFQSTGTFHSGPDHTNGLYIAMLYYTILDRDLDAAGYNFWVGIANGGGPGIEFQGAAAYATRIQILGPGTPNQGFIGSPEFQGLYQ